MGEVNFGGPGTDGILKAISLSGKSADCPEEETLIPINEEEALPPPDCESFNYSRIGNTNWQCSAVTGVHELFTVFNWQCIGYDWGIFTQPLYFQLPINNNYSLDSGSTKIESAAYLDMAFKAFDSWYKVNGCNAGAPALEQKLLEFIKDEFEENGGNVTLTPPLGFLGKPTAYKVTWSGYGNCD
ncbi:hypothetical protein K1F50_20755 [Muricauda oceani]|uniref:Uncharacterized protein n=1 Tax=Flagellimonas oceani TaxID=2698672 RepID=A0A6G7J6M9_9FLAO|nr:hypothetical protein [Allomuricauda oceani]QII46194.1 hypothetical protein GVT53_16410 [Allomuricauda oceani]